MGAFGNLIKKEDIKSGGAFSSLNKKPQETKKFNLFDFTVNKVSDFGKGTMNVVGGALAEGLSAPTRLAGALSTGIGKGLNYAGKSITGESGLGDVAEGIGKGISSFSEGTNKFIKKYGAYDKNSTGAKVGETGAKLAEAFVGPGGAALKTLEGTTGVVRAGKMLLQGAKAGAIGTPIYTGLSEGRLPTIGEEVTGTLGGAVGGLVLDKGSRMIGRGITNILDKRAISKNPALYAQKVNEETLSELTKIIKSPSGKMTEGQLKSKQAILLNGVKDVANEGGKINSLEDAIKETSKLKTKILEKQKLDNSKVTKITTANEIGDDINSFISENSRMDGGLKTRLQTLAKKIKNDKNYKSQFDNASQQDLQDLLTSYNAKLSDKTFINSANSDQIEEALMMSKILRNRIDTNLVETAGLQGNQGLRNKLGGLIELEKNLVNAYSKATGKNAPGLLGAYSDLLGVDILGDIIKGNWLQAGTNALKKIILKKGSEARDVNNLIADLFRKQKSIRGINVPSGNLKPIKQSNIKPSAPGSLMNEGFSEALAFKKKLQEQLLQETKGPTGLALPPAGTTGGKLLQTQKPLYVSPKGNISPDLGALGQGFKTPGTKKNLGVIEGRPATPTKLLAPPKPKPLKKTK